MIRSARSAAFAAIVLLLPLAAGAPASAADGPDPALVVTAADVAKVLGGTWTSESPEPGVLFYSESGGDYRSVQIYLWPANGKTIAAMTAQLTQEGEPVEEVSGVGDAAFYRPQRFEATVELKIRSGEVEWLSIAVQNAAKTETRRFAVELAKRGAERLKAL